MSPNLNSSPLRHRQRRDEDRSPDRLTEAAAAPRPAAAPPRPAVDPEFMRLVRAL